MSAGVVISQAVSGEDFVYARLSGPLNGETAASADGEVRSLIVAPCRRLILDLGAADYLDSDGIRWLQRIQSDLGRQDVDLRLCVREKSPADRTLSLLRLDAVFTIVRQQEEPSEAEQYVPTTG